MLFVDTMIFEITLTLIVIGGFISIFWFVHRQFSQLKNGTTQQQALEDMVNKVFGMSSLHISKQSKQILESEREHIQDDLQHSKQSIIKLVEELRKEIDERQ